MKTAGGGSRAGARSLALPVAAALAFLGPNGVFLWQVLGPPHALSRLVTDPLAMSLLVDAALATGLLALRHENRARGAGWLFLALALVGGLAFAVAVHWWRAGVRARRSAPWIALLAASTACSSHPTEPTETVGRIEGTVHVMGSVPIGAGAEMRVHVSVDDLNLARNARSVPLAGVHPDLRFFVDGLPEGTYYLNACSAYGCRFYGIGEPEPVEVVGGRSATIAMDF